MKTKKTKHSRNPDPSKLPSVFDGFRIVERKQAMEDRLHITWKLALFVGGEVVEELSEPLASLDMVASEEAAIEYGRISSAAKAVEMLLAFGTDTCLIADMMNRVCSVLRDRPLEIPGLCHFKTETSTTWHFVGMSPARDTRFMAWISPDTGLEVEDDPEEATKQFRSWVNDTLRQAGVLLGSQDLYRMAFQEGGDVIDR